MNWHRQFVHMKVQFGRKDRGMSRSKHTEAQMIAPATQVEAGRSAENVARVWSFENTIYAWKAKGGSMTVREAEEVKHLRDENARPELSSDKEKSQSVIRKNH
jgi:hypothetical protein